jgi:hypothetical protein
MDFILCDISFECGIVNMFLLVQSLVEKGYLEHQATVAKLGAYMGLGHQFLQL